MSIGGTEYTFYFAWSPPETPWDISLARFDENIFDLLIEHDEGQIPTATVEVKNPRIGFINPSRMYWCWLSFSYEACDPMPLFFGRLIGIPEEIEENTVRMKFITRDTDYVYQKQQVARSLKLLPNYDEIFFEVSKRDDPDAILEGWSALYHVDRVNGRVSASDILIGEDGTITFAAQDVFYDSVKCKILQSPLKAVNIKADVQWEQQYRGHFPLGQWSYPTLGGDAFVGDWPKSGSSLGGGWYVGVAWAGERDPKAGPSAQRPSQISSTYQWTNTAKKHQTGDTMSISINYTQPFGTAIILRQTSQIGIINPYAVDIRGDPDPINQPAKASIDYFCYQTFPLDANGKHSLATIGVIYEANRKRSERLEMTVEADVQPVLIDPLVVEDTEQITLKSGDLSLPLIRYLNWDTVGMGGAVELGTFIFPDNPRVPGQTSSQICVQAGNTGMQEPIFSNIAGQTTTDNTVVWASLGDTPPTEGAQDWVRSARIPLGTLLLPKPVSGVPDIESLLAPGQLQHPPVGIAVPIYSVFTFGFGGPGAGMIECVQSGIFGGKNVANDAVAGFSGFVNPSGKSLHICIQAGTSGGHHTTFNETLGGQTSDGGVVWQNIGPVNLPIGGWPGMTPSAVYFPTDRGQQSVQHMICRARAKLRKRARAVEVSFDTSFEVAAQLSCRMNGVVPDARLPGGIVAGKVISYKLLANGDGTLIGKVVLGCSIGKTPITIGALVRGAPQLLAVDPGVPSYVNNGYVKPGYQKYYSSTASPGSTKPPDQNVDHNNVVTPPNWPVLPPTLPPQSCPPLASTWSSSDHVDMGDDVGYTPPVSDPNDDGITFPASPSDVILRQRWHGKAATEKNGAQILNLEIEKAVHDAIAAANQTKNVSFPSVGGVGIGTITVPVTPFFDIQIAAEIAVLQKVKQGNNLWYELVLKQLTNGPFANYYVVETTPLFLPQSIDLSAAGS